MDALFGETCGCLTLIADSHVVQQEKNIREYYKKQESIVQAEKRISGFMTQESYDKLGKNLEKDLKNAKVGKGYICLCKCGKIRYLPKDSNLLSKKRRYCGNDCGLRKEHIKRMIDTYPTEKHSSYDLNLFNTVHETLEIKECVDENYKQAIVDDQRKKGAGRCIIYKKYKCHCRLCGKNHEFMSSDFEITLDGDRGYSSIAHCTCHPISSFQWRTVKILKEHNVLYNAEQWFPDLMNWNGYCFLKYDFAIIGSNGEVKFLIECQGEQHYKPVGDFGGVSQFEIQKRNDKKKREYAEQNNIPLIEIPYTCRTYEAEENFLKKHNII